MVQLAQIQPATAQKIYLSDNRVGLSSTTSGNKDEEYTWTSSIKVLENVTLEVYII